jgi:HopA1 effector protein family
VSAAGALPAEVAAAVDRVSTLVAHTPAGWTVGGGGSARDADALADLLYGAWYTQPAVAPPPAPGDPPLGRITLLPALRAAAARPPARDGSWTVTAAGPGGVIAAADGAAGGRATILRPGDYVMALRPGVPAAPGEPVAPTGPIDHLDAELGLWWSWAEPAPAPPLGRVYLDVRPATAARAVHEVTQALAPFAHQLKCPILPSACERVDAVVVYHARGDRDAVLAALAVRDRLWELLDPAVPPLTCAVAPGLAWADDPGDGRSYGESRSRLLALAIDAAAATWPALDGAARVALLVDALERAGLDPGAPWVVPA